MLAFTIGGGVYLILSSHYAEMLLGMALFSNGINLLLLESSQPIEGAVDPLPQALILTAIVIGFGLLAFMAAFVLNRIESNKTDLIQQTSEEDLL